jgi:hypothetical protein
MQYRQRKLHLSVTDTRTLRIARPQESTSGSTVSSVAVFGAGKRESRLQTEGGVMVYRDEIEHDAPREEEPNPTQQALGDG